MKFCNYLDIPTSYRDLKKPMAEYEHSLTETAQAIEAIGGKLWITIVR